MAEPEPLQQIDRTYVRFRNRKLSYFSGCDYFRLASDSRVKSALIEGVKNNGLNVAASRLTTGNHILYRTLERTLAKFFSAPTALLVSTGYLTNLVVAQSLAGNFSHALLDERAHPSLFDAASFLNCPVVRFKHRDVEGLAKSIHRCGPRSRLVILTDGMFGSDGSVAPLAEYVRTLPKDAWMLVDDAHGAGVLGAAGKGSLEHAGIPRRRIIQTVTLSKAFGVYGGAILCAVELRKIILERSSIFVGCTPLPLPLARAALQSVNLMRKGKPMRERLRANVRYVQEALHRSGIMVPEYPGPIVALVPGTARQKSQLERQLLHAGIYPPFVRYPGGPVSGYFRFAISSGHSREQLNNLIKVLARFGGKFQFDADSHQDS